MWTWTRCHKLLYHICLTETWEHVPEDIIMTSSGLPLINMEAKKLHLTPYKPGSAQGFILLKGSFYWCDVSVYFLLSSKSTKFLFLQRNLCLKTALSRKKGQKLSHCDNARNDKITLILTFLSGKKICILIRRNSDTNYESESRVSRRIVLFSLILRV